MTQIFVRYYKILYRHESKAFIIWTLLHTLPVLMPAFYMSYDGPAHLYNSRLLAEWFGPNRTWLEQFLFLQSEPLPNWITYPFLAVIGELSNYFWADKLLQLIYVVGMLYSFRYLARSFSPKISLLSWLGGLLVYHNATGMYNFSASLPLLMFLIGRYQRVDGQFSYENTSLFLIISLLLYFSHLTGFLASGLLCGLLWINQQWKAHQENRFQLPQALHALGATFLFFLPGLAMAIAFIMQRSGNPSSGFSLEILLAKLSKTDVLIIFHTAKESAILRFIYLIVALVLLSNWKIQKKNRWQLNPLAMGMIAMLVLYFIIPDASMGASYTSNRLQLFFLILTFAWLYNLTISWKTELISWSIVVVLSLALLWRYSQAWRELSEDVAPWEAAAQYVPDRSRVLTLNYSSHWYHEHISNFLALDTPLILMYENYEACNDYFPIRFKSETLEKYRKLRPLLTWPPQPDDQSLQHAPNLADVIVRWCYDPLIEGHQHAGLDSMLEQHYSRFYASENNKLELFKIKSTHAH